MVASSSQPEPTDAHFEMATSYIDLMALFNERYDVQLFRADHLPITHDTPRARIVGNPDDDAINVDRWCLELKKVNAPETDFVLFIRDGKTIGLDLVLKKEIDDFNDSAFLRRALAPPAAANDNDPDADIDLPEEAPVPGLPDGLWYPPGAVGEFARFMVSASRFPSPTLALASSLALTSALIGRRYKGPTGLRSNVYIVGLAESGFGKDTTLRGAQHIASSTQARETVLDKFFIDDISSTQGLANKLRRDPAAVLFVDEFGKWLEAHTSRKAPPYKEAIAAALLQLTGAATGVWGGTEKAAGNLPRVYNPCFSIYGVSTPSTFWNALSGGNISEGLLGRLILFDAGNIMPTKVRRPTADFDHIPTAIGASVQEIIGGKIGGNLFGLTQSGEVKPAAVIGVPFAPGVDDLFESFDDRMRGEIRTTDSQYRPLFTRVAENAGRLALIVAVGCNPAEPVVTAEIQDWANAVAEASLRIMIKGAGDNIADTERQADYLRLRGFIARTGDKGVNNASVVKYPRGRYDRRQLNDMLSTMRGAGEIEYASHISSKGQEMKRWWAKEHLPKGAVKAMPPIM